MTLCNTKCNTGFSLHLVGKVQNMFVETAFAQMVFRARKQRRLSQEAAAELCGMSTRHYQSIEAGIVNPGLIFVIQIAIAFDLDLNQLKTCRPHIWESPLYQQKTGR